MRECTQITDLRLLAHLLTEHIFAGARRGSFGI
jgi:hypothetical protein